MFLDTHGLCDGEIYLELQRTAAADELKGYVPAYHFNIRRQSDQQLLGRCDLRVGHNDNIYYGGNIGYEIMEAYRGNRYATKACRLLFAMARRHGMDHLLITCSPDNIASRKTCEYAGCRLIEIAKLPVTNEMYLLGDREKCVFRIDL